MATTRSSTASGTRPASGTDMSTEFERVDEEVRAFVQERPVMALLGAIAAGYFIGRIMRRLA
jgi:hypothetical protein